MSDNVLETVRATVQDFLAPEIRTHGVRLENLERRLDEMKHSLEQRSDDLKHSFEQRSDSIQHSFEQRSDAMQRSFEQRSDDLKSSLEHRIEDTKDLLRAEMRALDARMTTIENLIRGLIQQVSVEAMLRERVASLEARMPKQ